MSLIDQQLRQTAQKSAEPSEPYFRISAYCAYHEGAYPEKGSEGSGRFGDRKNQ
jgi:hypothetical protein